MTGQPTGPYLTVKSLAAYLGLAEQTIRNQRAAGKLPPAYVINGSLRWTRADIDTWLATTREDQRP